jgi:hypothetical protein
VQAGSKKRSILSIKLFCLSKKVTKKDNPDEASAHSKKNKKITESSPSIDGNAGAYPDFLSFFFHSQRWPAVMMGHRSFVSSKQIGWDKAVLSVHILDLLEMMDCIITFL